MVRGRVQRPEGSSPRTRRRPRRTRRDRGASRRVVPPRNGIAAYAALFAPRAECGRDPQGLCGLRGLLRVLGDEPALADATGLLGLSKTAQAEALSGPEPESGGEVAERGRSARNRDVAPCFRVTGTVLSFRRRRLRSARPVHASRRGRASGDGPRGFRHFPTPTLSPHSALSVVSPRRAEGFQASRAPGFRSPRAVRRPHAPDIPQVTGFKPRKGPGDDSGTTFPARSHPAAR